MVTGNCKISVITVSFNSEKTIGDTISSILNQTINCYEYIIIDGKSTDGTINIAQKYNKDFSAKGIKYTVISEPDNGIYDAMNKGIALASGDLIGIINSDDWYEPTAFEEITKAYMQYGEGVYYGILKIWKEGKIFHIKQHTHEWLQNSMPQHPTWFVSKSLYEEYGAYSLDYRLSSDYELANRFYQAGVPFFRLEKIISNFREGGASRRLNLLNYMESLSIKSKYGYIREYEKKFEYFRVKNAKYIDYVFWLPIKLIFKLIYK